MDIISRHFFTLLFSFAIESCIYETDFALNLSRKYHFLILFMEKSILNFHFDYLTISLSDTFFHFWQIEKLDPWHWGLVIDSQRVTWTAFAILAMFRLIKSAYFHASTLPPSSKVHYASKNKFIKPGKKSCICTK